MSLNSAENLGFKIVTMGREEIDKRKPCNLRTVTQAKLQAWIDAKSIDPRLKEELKKSVANYPQQALSTWQKMYNKHLVTAQNVIKGKSAPIPTENTIEKDQNNVPENDFDAGWNENPG
jgi:hypothetical protein